MGGGGEWERWSRVVRQHYAPRAIMFSYHPAPPQHTDTLKDGKGSEGDRTRDLQCHRMALQPTELYGKILRFTYHTVYIQIHTDTLENGKES